MKMINKLTNVESEGESFSDFCDNTSSNRNSSLSFVMYVSEAQERAE